MQGSRNNQQQLTNNDTPYDDFFPTQVHMFRDEEVEVEVDPIFSIQPSLDSDAEFNNGSSGRGRRVRVSSSSAANNSNKMKKCFFRCLVPLAVLIIVVTAVVVSLLLFNGNSSSSPEAGADTEFPDNDSSSSPHNSASSRIVLGPDENLYRGQYVRSPSGRYQLGLTQGGEFVLMDAQSKQTIWNAGVEGASKVRMQDDGNLVVRNKVEDALWSSKTYGHPGSKLIVDDGGRIHIYDGSTLVWTQGIPPGVVLYNNNNNNKEGRPNDSQGDLTLPVRGAFYYSWYPDTWTVSSGETAIFVPDLGMYSSGDPTVIENHIDAFEYGNIDLGIISWWGPSTNKDRSRITLLMDKTLERKANVKWTLYYEDEWKLDPTVEQIKSELEYMKQWFFWHPSYAHVDGGKPLIFIWNEGDCNVVTRWMEATKNNGGGEESYFVIPKLFDGYKDCPIQPNNWHQYGPASAIQQHKGDSFTISPGFHKANEATARLPRLTKSEWCQNVQAMVDSNEPWQLITTFNEAGEGTLIEASSANWPSDSGYGYYLDCLHDIV